jgi:hypothetical protein
MAKFEVLTAISVKMAVIWDIALCSLVEADQCFSGTYCLHHQADVFTSTSTLPAATATLDKLNQTYLWQLSRTVQVFPPIKSWISIRKIFLPEFFHCTSKIREYAKIITQNVIQFQQ